MILAAWGVGVPLTSTEERLGMLINTLQRTAAPTTETPPVPTLTVTRIIQLIQKLIDWR